MASGTGPNDKRKWISYAAAMLLFIDLDEQARLYLMHQIAGIGIGHVTFADMIAQAKAGTLTLEIRQIVEVQGEWEVNKKTRGGSRVAPAEQTPEKPEAKNPKK